MTFNLGLNTQEQLALMEYKHSIFYFGTNGQPYFNAETIKRLYPLEINHG